jgi:hypothetical protein
MWRVVNRLRSPAIEKGGPPGAVLRSVRDYLKLAAPEPKVLKVIGEESVRNGTDKLNPRQIDRIIKAARSQENRR